MTKKNSHCLIRLIPLLFALYVAVPIISYSYVPGHGLFGEMKFFVVVNEDNEEILEAFSKTTVSRNQKGKNIFNIWLLVLAYITCLRLLEHSIKLPKADTIVAKKVRMNN